MRKGNKNQRDIKYLCYFLYSIFVDKLKKISNYKVLYQPENTISNITFFFSVPTYQ
jgi:hypothetical protein